MHNVKGLVKIKQTIVDIQYSDNVLNYYYLLNTKQRLQRKTGNIFLRSVKFRFLQNRNGLHEEKSYLREKNVKDSFKYMHTI